MKGNENMCLQKACIKMVMSVLFIINQTTQLYINKGTDKQWHSHTMSTSRQWVNFANILWIQRSMNEYI